MWECHDLENERHALEAAIGGVGVAVSRLVDDRPRSESKPEFTIEELLAMGDDVPTQTWDGDDPVILDLQRLERSLVSAAAALEQMMEQLRAAEDEDEE